MTSPSNQYFNSGNKEQDYITLIDCAYDIMEIWDVSESPYNQQLKKDWLKRARELGAEPPW